MTNQIESSRKSVQAAINLRAALNAVRALAGDPDMKANQAEKVANGLLDAISPLAPLTPKPFLLTAPEGTPEEKPGILDALAIVLGRQTLTIDQIAKELQDRGWLPTTRIRYVSDILSRNSEGRGTNRFTRTRPGVYKVARERRKLVFQQRP